MFEDAVLANHIKNNHTLELRTIVLSEWNMNQTDNVRVVGNYRYRPPLEDILEISTISSSAVSGAPPAASSAYSTLVSIFDDHDVADAYTDATKSTLYVDAGYDGDQPVNFISANDRQGLLYDLEQCVYPFRPRSGINKVMLNATRPSFVDKIRSAERPRYYFSSRADPYKYWNSYRTEEKQVYGISTAIDNYGIGYQIQDTCPFVVYETEIPANRITVKVQTNVGSYSIGSGDPLYGTENATVPRKWRLEYLTPDYVWQPAMIFDESVTRIDGSPVFGWDGYAEIKYGIAVPDAYKDNFWFVDYISSTDLLPPVSSGVYVGEAYAVVTDNTPGDLYIMGEDSQWDIYPIEYKFSLLENDDYGYGMRSCVTNVVDPPYYLDGTRKIYREFLFIKGVRIVVETMNTPNTMFELIEMSPRLIVDITKYASQFDFTKSIHNSDIELPVGGLIASNGSIELSNDDLAFSKLNAFDGETGSLIANYLHPNVKFIFFEGIRRVGVYEKLIPVKWLYAESWPESPHQMESLSVDLRDLYFLLEFKKAPEIFLRNITLTAAVCILLDGIGFSNYRFIGFEGNDPIIPNFFVGPDQNVAEVLNNLSIATQSAMFFDEYNNFTVYSKEYLFTEREQALDLNINIDTTYTDGEWIDADGENIGLPNVMSMSNDKISVINDGSLSFTTRYIQRSVTKVKQAYLLDEERSYGYKPVLLWEVAPTDSEKSVNEAVQQQEGFVLGALTINSDLTDAIPVVENNTIINNVIDVGANIYWVPRHAGYLYANGEIIKYDAIEYVVSGQTSPIWISDNRHYQHYFGNMPFNGTMYPTGNIRIYVEPYYETLGGITQPKNGAVRVHGRGQFGTPVVYHAAGIAPEWTADASVVGMTTDSVSIFTSTSSTATPSYKYTPSSTFTSSTDTALRSKRTDIIKNFMSTKNIIEGSYLTIDGNSTYRQTSVYGIPRINSAALRASALVFTGPQQFNGSSGRDFVTYVKKNITSTSGIFTHFGTRVRIIGEINANDTNMQTPLGSMQYFSYTPQNADEAVTISGGSGGLGIMLNGESGYFLEIMSLTEDVSKEFLNLMDANSDFSQMIENVVLWKKSSNNAAIQKLWGGTTNIMIDTGIFVGQDRAVRESIPTVYDLGIEYKDEGGKRKFNIFINGKQVATDITDTSPLPMTQTIGPFVRGSSKCMFENIFAVGLNASYSADHERTISEYIRPDLNPESPSSVFRKFSINSFVTDSYLTNLNTRNISKYILFYEEFGTIMREAMYFNIKYDQAYPALYAKIAPTFNKERGYSIAGFQPTPYGAEFLIFNNTDKALRLDETTGNFLRISGIAFTQETTYEYTVDEYFKKISNFVDDRTITRNLFAANPNRLEAEYSDIKSSRSMYGTQGFSIGSDYIQTWTQADDLMGWIIERRFKPKDQYTMSVFGVPHLQLGDMTSIHYQVDGRDMIDSNKRFIVSDMQHTRSVEGMETTIRVVEI